MIQNIEVYSLIKSIKIKSIKAYLPRNKIKPRLKWIEYQRKAIERQNMLFISPY